MRALLLAVTLSTLAYAQVDRGRAEYHLGKLAFDRHEYQSAYDHFKQAYMITEKPELLFNMALALEELKRPHDAAEALRTYLKFKPQDPDRVGIETRIQALEEKQRLLDQDRPKPALVVPAQTLVQPPPPAPEKKSNRLALIVGISVGAVAVIALGVGLGVGLGNKDPEHSSSSLGAWAATR
jgi:tetratricopeptide (TPR) repeat protein